SAPSARVGQRRGNMNASQGSLWEAFAFSWAGWLCGHRHFLVEKTGKPESFAWPPHLTFGKNEGDVGFRRQALLLFGKSVRKPESMRGCGLPCGRRNPRGRRRPKRRRPEFFESVERRPQTLRAVSPQLSALSQPR